MESMRGRKGIGERASAGQVVYEDFQPVADWTNDSNNHVLRVDLPGFKKEQVKLEAVKKEGVKLEVVNNGTVMVSGERQLSGNRYKRFKQDYSLPIDSDIDKISAKIDGGLLYVIIPKKEYETEEEPKKGGKDTGEKEEEGFKFGFAERATEMISENKGMVLVAVLGFTVGMYLSYKLRSTDQ